MGAGNTKIMALPAGEKMFLQVPMRSPSLPGIYQGKWRLCTPCGTYFGGNINNPSTDYFLLKLNF